LPWTKRARLAELDHEVVALAETAPYRDPVGWLRCFRGIDTLSAMTLVVEVVDFQRFARPRQLMAYLGLVPSEHSSGDAQRRGALTKAGSSHARACSSKPPGITATAPASVPPWPLAVRGSPGGWSPRPGAPNSGCIGVIAI
jgi:hypothetical protein